MLRFLAVLLLPLLFSSCAGKTRTYDIPDQNSYTNASVVSYNQDIRHWGDEISANIYKDVERLRSNKALYKQVDILALSSGSQDGAYGAGFLKGWSERGDRPEFFMVTGVSTGALFEAIFGGPSANDSTPLRKRLKKFVNDQLVADIAREAKKGRVLEIGTTNLDAQRPVVWNITKIAQSGRADAKELILDIMLASSSIPGIFPPILIDVTIDGKRYQELHVDGGVTKQMFVYPHSLDIPKLQKKLGAYPKKNFWLIRNTKIDPEYTKVSLKANDIVDRSISTLIKYQGLCELHNIISMAKRDGFDVHITNIPSTFNVTSKDIFDREYMRTLYQVGYKRGRTGLAWQNTLK